MLEKDVRLTWLHQVDQVRHYVMILVLMEAVERLVSHRHEPEEEAGGHRVHEAKTGQPFPSVDDDLIRRQKQKL